VVEAEELMRAARFLQAAERFHTLANEADVRGRPEAAAELYLRAARCDMETGELDRADEAVEQAIHLLIDANRPARVRQVLPRVLAALERHGRQTEMERLQLEVEMIFHGDKSASAWGLPSIEMVACLPANCPGCGAPIKATEVSWAGPVTAECPYCGGTVPAEE
jgi:hypothetical protein